MKTNLKACDVSPDLKSAVRAYLMARAYAETMRSAVDKIERQVLAECPLTNGLLVEEGKPAGFITDPKLVYLCTDEELVKDYYAESSKRERTSKLKPDTMQDDYCPALVAEDIQRQAEQLVIDCAAKMLHAENESGDFHHRLLCLGLDKYHQFIDLAVRLVVNLPDFDSQSLLKQSA